jgi:SAM-dependent methyltransferase
VNTPNATAPLGFALKTILAQAIAISSAFILWPLHHSAVIALALATACAYVTARFQQLPVSWTLINALLPLAAALNLSVEIPGWLFSVPFVLLALTYAPALWTRVPYYPTPRAAYALLLAELPSDRPFTFIDIGCGFGDLLRFLSERRPLGQFIGIEVGPLPWFVANIRTIFSRRKNLSILYRDMWRYPLSDVDVVYTFLSPAAMPRIWQKVSAELRPGSKFITLAFPVPSKSDEMIAVKDQKASKLYIHRLAREQQLDLC